LDAVNLKPAVDYPLWFPVISFLEWPSRNQGRTDQTQRCLRTVLVNALRASNVA